MLKAFPAWNKAVTSQETPFQTPEPVPETKDIAANIRKMELAEPVFVL